MHVDATTSAKGYVEEVVDDPKRRSICVTDSGRSSVEIGVCFRETEGDVQCGRCGFEGGAVGDDIGVGRDQVFDSRVNRMTVAAIVVLGCE